MTDQDLEQRLRAWYRADIDDRESAPLQLRDDLATLVRTGASSRWRLAAGWRFPSLNRFAPLALAATAIVVVILVGIGLITRPSTNVGHQTPLPSALVTPTPAARPASWRATGGMITARTNGTPHTEFIATLLLDGRVLVTGGYQSHVLAETELYDPGSGRWTATGDLITPRTRQSVTLLPDGRVLVAGGIGPPAGFAGLASAEVYDPATGTWTATGNMHSAREGHLAVALPDGRVLVIGGGGVSSAEVYDPRSGAWTTTGAPTGNVSASATATVLTNGDVLLVGYEFAAQLYHPASGTWRTTNPMIQRRAYHAATVLADGRVLVAGGWIGGPVISSAEIYDPSAESWDATGGLLQNSEPNASMLLADGEVLVVTGDSAELYNPMTGQWRMATGMPAKGRGGSAAVLLADGTVLIAGGDDASGVSASTSAYIYDPGVGN